jgi:hypothetical protein
MIQSGIYGFNWWQKYSGYIELETANICFIGLIGLIGSIG